MPEWLAYLLADTSALQLVFWVIAIVGLVGAIVKLYPALSRTVAVVNSVAGLPEFIERTDKSIEALRHQIENDHQTNMRDELTEVLETSRETAGKVEKLMKSDAAQWEQIDRTKPPARKRATKPKEQP